MGGKKKGGALGVIRGAANSGINLASGGIYNPETGTIKTGQDQLENVVTSASGQRIVDGATPELPSLPKDEDPSLQAKRAEAEAAEKVKQEVGQRGRGLSSTILGGSTSLDSTILKKKKLLGE